MSGDSAEGTFALNSGHNGARVVSEKGANVKNRAYSFTLKGGTGGRTIKSALGPSISWSMPDDLIGRDLRSSSVKGVDGAFGMAMEMACTGQMLWGGWLPLMVSSPDFKLVRVTNMPGNGDLVKVEFEFEPKGLTGGNAPARSGMVVLDARRYWLISQAETKASGMYGQGSLKIVNEFTDDTLPVPFVSRCVIHILIPKDSQFDGKRYEGDFTWNIEMQDAPDMDDKPFTLSAFGFSEPGPSQASSRRLWMLWGTLALLAVLAVVFAYRRWRKPEAV